jgi:hypothetical protein
MTSEKILARSSNGWYIWATATAAMIVADVALHGVTGRTIFLSLLSVTFAGLMLSAGRAEDRVVARYQERPPLVGRATTMPLATRIAILSSIQKSLWPLWLVLLASSLASRMTGDLNLSWALTEGMIALALLGRPLRVLTAVVLFR